jgi:hypothetical protein
VGRADVDARAGRRIRPTFLPLGAGKNKSVLTIFIEDGQFEVAL